MNASIDEREASGFFLNDPKKLDDPFPDLQYLRAHKPVFYYAPLDSWFIFAYDDVLSLFDDARLSADRMKDSWTQPRPKCAPTSAKSHPSSKSGY